MAKHDVVYLRVQGACTEDWGRITAWDQKFSVPPNNVYLHLFFFNGGYIYAFMNVMLKNPGLER